MGEPRRFLVALADPTKSLHDGESGWSISGDNVRELTDPFPSERVRQWFLLGGLVEVKPEQVKFFYTKTDLNKMPKAEVVETAESWDIEIQVDGKDKTKEVLIQDLLDTMR